MGAQEFSVTSKGKTAEQAFAVAVADARYDRGHGGYTGTIAEKNGYKVFRVPVGVELGDFVDWFSNSWGDNVSKIPVEHRGHVARVAELYDDKWGPAVCIKVDEPPDKDGDTYLFCGWASS